MREKVLWEALDVMLKKRQQKRGRYDDNVAAKGSDAVKSMQNLAKYVDTK